MNIRAIIQDHLSQKRVMQLATQNDKGELWACTVHFYSDDTLNIYWVSNINREHSKHIAQTAKVAIALVVHEDTPDEKYVIGLSMTGTAIAMDTVDTGIAASYVSKLQKDPALIEQMKASTTRDKFYKFTPRRIVLLDSKNFPDNPRQELELSI